jgi:hypothetical protein
MTDAQRGKYIVLLCLQHQQGFLSEDDMNNICKTYDEKIYSKFEKDMYGNYTNKRMLLESERRSKYAESRRNNRLKKEDNICKTYDKHMENENININIDVDKSKNKEEEILKRKKDFYEEYLKYEDKYTGEMLEAFFNYWTAHSPGARKMRFEMEKVFDMGRRLVTWESNEKKFKK